MKMDPYLTPYTEISSKWIEDLNVRPETTEVLEQNTGSHLLDIGLGDYEFFLKLMPKERQ